jgi:hypothetical protein
MTGRIATLAAAALLLAGCGGDTSSNGTTETTGTTPGTTTSATSTEPTTSLQVYFYRDAALVPVTVEVPETEAVATAALERLLAGPPQGYETTVPPGTELMAVAVADGIATASFSSELGAEPPRTAQGQLVATLSQFPTVDGVHVEVEGAGPVELTDGAGEPVAPGGAATADDYVDLTAEAPIFVRTPARDSTVSRTVSASGTANVFEATIHVEVWSGERMLRTELITATSGSGTRGTWAHSFELPLGPAKLVFFEPSAEDGSPLHETEVFLTVE